MLEVVLGADQPLGMLAQHRQAPDTLMETATQGVGNRITEQAAGIGEQQCLPQLQGAIAGQHGEGEQHHGARDDDAGHCQALQTGD